jgi:hypothetical protein
MHTVSPLDKVVDSVFTPFFTTGVAKPLFNGATALRVARLRSPWVRLRANRRDAIGDVSDGDEGSSWIEVVECRDLMSFSQICELFSPANQSDPDDFG